MISYDKNLKPEAIKEKSKEKITKNAREGSLRVLNNSEDNYQNQQTSSKKHLQTKETANFNGEDLNENHSINNIKDLINSQKEVIIEAVKPKVPIEEPKKNVRAKPKPKPKPKKVEKTLDLTIPDKEVEQIISGNKLQVKSSDTKLQAFLDAFKRN